MKRYGFASLIFSLTLISSPLYAQSYIAQSLCTQLKKLPAPFSQAGVLSAGKQYQFVTEYITSTALSRSKLATQVCNSYANKQERSECLSGPLSFTNELIGMKNLLNNPKQSGANDLIPETFGQVAFNLSHYLQTTCEQTQ